MSYLAQTPEPAPVILYSPECVDEAASADSQLSILRVAADPVVINPRRSDHIQLIGILHPCAAAKSAANTVRPRKLSDIL